MLVFIDSKLESCVLKIDCVYHLYRGVLQSILLADIVLLIQMKLSRHLEILKILVAHEIESF